MPSKLTWTNFWRRNQAATKGDLDDAKRELLDAIRGKGDDAATEAKLAADLKHSSDALKKAVENTKPTP